MGRRTAMILSGAITAFVLMVVVGLVYGANRFNAAAATLPAPLVAPGGAALSGDANLNTNVSTQDNSADTAALQAQVQSLKDQLQKAYADLQTAYNQISAMQNQGASGGGRLRGSERRAPSQLLPFSDSD